MAALRNVYPEIMAVLFLDNVLLSWVHNIPVSSLCSALFPSVQFISPSYSVVKDAVLILDRAHTVVMQLLVLASYLCLAKGCV